MPNQEEQYQLFEEILRTGEYLTERQFQNCEAFVRMGKEEGLKLEQVCQILVSDGFLSEEAATKVLGRVRGEGEELPERPQTADEEVEAVSTSQPETTSIPGRTSGAEEPVQVSETPAPPGTEECRIPPGTKDPALPKIEQLLRRARELGASDLHLSVGRPPILRLFGRLRELDYEALTAEESLGWLEEILTPVQMERFREEKELDFSYSPIHGERYRSNALWDRHGAASSFRIIAERIATLEELGMPPVLKKLTEYRQGLVLVTGPAGSGKSTTLAALISIINKTRKEHVITVEDPVEFIQPSDQALINHRQIGENTKSFANALRSALREDPDIIMVGEMRDLETISMAITAAETGHLVFGTLHTRSASRTIDRILDVFPPKEQSQIRAMVSESLRAVVSQQLIPNCDGKGLSVAVEILIMTPAASNLIRDGRTFQLPSVIQTGKRFGMQLLDDNLMELVESGRVAPEEAALRSENPGAFKRFIEE